MMIKVTFLSMDHSGVVCVERKKNTGSFCTRRTSGNSNCAATCDYNNALKRGFIMNDAFRVESRVPVVESVK